MTRYTEHLEATGVPLFHSSGETWRLYRGALVPAPKRPSFPHVTSDDATRLQRESCSSLIRWTDSPNGEHREWYWVICQTYDTQRTSAKVRGEIRRAHRDCRVDRVSASWLASHGYQCYRSAFDRYRNLTVAPVDPERFAHDMMQTHLSDVFEYWGVFVGSSIAGYSCFVLEDEYASMTTMKMDPAFLRSYSSYALLDSTLNHYVTERGLTVSNGMRSIEHDTLFDDLLLRKFQFTRQYCHLNMVYSWPLRLAVNTLYPFRSLLFQLPDLGPVHKAKGLLYSEQLRRRQTRPKDRIYEFRGR